MYKSGVYEHSNGQGESAGFDADELVHQSGARTNGRHFGYSSSSFVTSQADVNDSSYAVTDELTWTWENAVARHGSLSHNNFPSAYDGLQSYNTGNGTPQQSQSIFATASGGPQMYDTGNSQIQPSQSVSTSQLPSNAIYGDRYPFTDRYTLDAFLPDFEGQSYDEDWPSVHSDLSERERSQSFNRAQQSPNGSSRKSDEVAVSQNFQTLNGLSGGQKESDRLDPRLAPHTGLTHPDINEAESDSEHHQSIAGWHRPSQIDKIAKPSLNTVRKNTNRGHEVQSDQSSASGKREVAEQHQTPIKRSRLGTLPGEPCKRSKSGCLTCRSRRVKCDEVRPKCEKCVKSGRDCNYDGVSEVPYDKWLMSSPTDREFSTSSKLHSSSPLIQPNKESESPVPLADRRPIQYKFRTVDGPSLQINGLKPRSTPSACFHYGRTSRSHLSSHEAEGLGTLPSAPDSQHTASAAQSDGIEQILLLYGAGLMAQPPVSMASPSTQSTSSTPSVQMQASADEESRGYNGLMVDDLCLMGGREPPSTPEIQLPLDPNTKKDVEYIFLNVYARAIDALFETTWYSECGMQRFLNTPELLKKFTGMLQLFEETSNAHYEIMSSLPSLEARVMWRIMNLARASPSPNEQDTRESSSDLQVLLRRLKVFELLLTDGTRDWNSMTAPDAALVSRNAPLAQQMKFWNLLMEFCKDHKPGNAQPDKAYLFRLDSVLEGLRSSLNQMESRDILFAIATLRYLGGPNSPLKKQMDHEFIRDKQADFDIAKKLLDEEATRGTTQIIQRLSAMALRKMAAADNGSYWDE